MADENQDAKAVAAQVAAEAKVRGDELRAKKAARDAGHGAPSSAPAAPPQPPTPMQIETLPDIAERSSKKRRERGERQTEAPKPPAASEADSVRQKAGVDALRNLMGLPAETPAEEPEPAQAEAPAEMSPAAIDDLVARMRGEQPKGPQPLPGEHKEALLALQVPDKLIQEWAKTDPDGLAKFAEQQYEARRKREDAFANRDRLIATAQERLRALEQAVGIGEPTPPVQGGAQPGANGEARRAAPGEDGTLAATSPGSPDLAAAIEAAVRKALAPQLEAQAQAERGRMVESVREARRELGKSWPGLLDDTTFSQRVAPLFEQLYRADVAGRDVRALMQLAAFQGLGGTTAPSDVLNPSPPRHAPGTRQGQSPPIASLTPREAGAKALSELLRSGDVKQATRYAEELSRSVR